MRLLHWCMLGVTVLLLMCGVVISHLCRCLITMVDAFQTLFILMHIALPLPETAASGKPPPSSSASSASPPQADLPSSSVAGLLLKSPPANQAGAVSDQPLTAPAGHAADLLVDQNQQSPPNIPPAASNCGLSYSRSRIQAVGIFLSALLLTSLCTSYLMEIISAFLNPHEVQQPLLLVVLGAVSLLQKMLVFGLNWDHLQDEQAGGGEEPQDYSGLQVQHKVLAEEESVRRQEHEHKDDSLHGITFCNPQSSSIPDCDAQTPQQDPEGLLPENRAESSDACSGSEAFVDWKRVHHKGRHAASRQHPVCRLPSVSILQGLFTSVLALINSLVVLLLAPQLPHSSDACHPLVYLDAALALLAVITLIASTLPQVYRYGLLLLQATPPHICVSDVGRRIASVPGVQAVHDLHLWQLNESAVVASVHVHCYAGFPAHRSSDLMSRVTKVLQSVGVSCCTVQPEFACAAASSAGSSVDASPVIHREDPSPPPHLTCSLACGKDCSDSMCCSLPEEEIQGVFAPPGGETREEPQTLVIENTFL
ncbi:zinc/cadmium resistance protein [Salarias fasciatus]|uniref:zinc/cadmium resistance protein n=1 Tax=Salarias fasciatus TaxID=181472 RepID=UPI001176D30E|nr:zinc/cadmium resistance protein-like [Salarias fasciatus]